MLVYETYQWFSRALVGRAERERRRACVVLLAVLVLVYLHSGEAASFQTAIARFASGLLGHEVTTAGLIDLGRMR